MNTNPRKPMHSCLVIFLCSVGGILLALIVSWVITAYPKEPPELPTQLPPPPAKAQTILGGTSSSFYYYELYVQSTDGNTYKYQTQEWTPTDPPETYNDTDCQAEDIQSIESTAGKIQECRQIEIIGEWCGGGSIDYAITAEGDLWSLKIPSPQPCTVGYIIIAIILVKTYALWGFVLGVIIVCIRWLINKRKKEAQSKLG